MFLCPNCRRPLVRTAGPKGVLYVCPGCGGREVGLSVVRHSAGERIGKDLWLQGMKKGISRWQEVSGLRPLDAGSPLARRSPGTPLGPVPRVPVRLVRFPRVRATAGRGRKAEGGSVALLETREKAAMAQIKLHDELDAIQGNGGVDSPPEELPEWVTSAIGPTVEAEPVRSLPWLTWGLAAVLVLLFFLAIADPKGAIKRFGLIPDQAFRQGGRLGLSSFFVHRWPLHLAVDVFFLVIIGSHVEDYLGRWLSGPALGGDTKREPDLRPLGAAGPTAFGRGQRRDLRDHRLLCPAVPPRRMTLGRGLYMPAFVFLALWVFLQCLWGALRGAVVRSLFAGLPRRRTCGDRGLDRVARPVDNVGPAVPAKLVGAPTTSAGRAGPTLLQRIASPRGNALRFGRADSTINSFLTCPTPGSRLMMAAAKSRSCAVATRPRMTAVSRLERHIDRRPFWIAVDFSIRAVKLGWQRPGTGDLHQRTRGPASVERSPQPRSLVRSAGCRAVCPGVAVGLVVPGCPGWNAVLGATFCPGRLPTLVPGSALGRPWLVPMVSCSRPLPDVGWSAGSWLHRSDKRCPVGLHEGPRRARPPPSASRLRG